MTADERAKLKLISVTVVAIAAALALLHYVLLPLLEVSRTTSGDWQTPGPVLLLGGIVGLTYGLLAAGLVLIYRTNRIINFAHGQMGAFAAAFLGIEVVNWDVPYWVAIVPALAVGAAVAVVIEAGVIRRLRTAPQVMSVVATLAVGQFLVLLAQAVNSRASAGASYPMPPGFPDFRFGALLVTPAYTAMLILSPIVALGVGLFLKFTRYGMAMRAAADNPDAARMAGVFVGRMSSLAWLGAGLLATFAAILTQPTQGFASSDSFGPSLLLVALTGAVIARMRSLPVALGAGVCIGVVEQVLLWNYADPGLVQVVLFVAILLALLLQRQQVGRGEDKGSWATVGGPTPLPRTVRALLPVRLVRFVIGALVLSALLILPQLVTHANAIKVTGVFAFAIIGLSVGIVTGLSGQLSLGQFALGAVGAIASYEVAHRTDNYLLAFAYAGIAAAVVSVLIGLPALRVKGLLLTVTSLSFALVVPGYVLSQSWALGQGRDPGRPTVVGNLLDSGRSYYYVGLATLCFALLIAHNVRSSGIGRRLVAVRDNEDAARGFTVPAARVKLQGFALAGFLAGIGGAMYAHSLSLVSASSFPTSASIDTVMVAVVGGVGTLTGPLLGALVIQGANFLPLDAVGLAISAFGQLAVVMYLPGGLASMIEPVRDRFARGVARRVGLDLDDERAAEHGFGDRAASSGARLDLHAPRRVRTNSGVLLRATGLRRSFGGVHAVRGVSLEVRAGETLGLIGPNGAGKTTTFELLAGFTRVDAGMVTFAGVDVTHRSPEARGRLGLIRSFQDAALFPTLTVQESVELALERVQPTTTVQALLGLRRAERSKARRAAELVAWMGLERYASSQIQELSTGTRRIAEIACLVALEPTLLLLDEPSSGVAQKETEALAQLLLRLKAELGLTLIIIEHDIPMIMSLSDRIVCMADGDVIAEGPPSVVRTDPLVVEAYLGGSLPALERPGTRAADLSLAERVPGLGKKRADELFAAFGSIEALAEADPQALIAVKGMGPRLAARVHGALTGRSS